MIEQFLDWKDNLSFEDEFESYLDKRWENVPSFEVFKDLALEILSSAKQIAKLNVEVMVLKNKLSNCKKRNSPKITPMQDKKRK